MCAKNANLCFAHFFRTFSERVLGKYLTFVLPFVGKEYFDILKQAFKALILILKQVCVTVSTILKVYLYYSSLETSYTNFVFPKTSLIFHLLIRG